MSAATKNRKTRRLYTHSHRVNPLLYSSMPNFSLISTCCGPCGARNHQNICQIPWFGAHVSISFPWWGL